MRIKQYKTVFIRLKFYISFIFLSTIFTFHSSLILAQGTLKTIISNGPRQLKINIVILAEGYTTEEETLFSEDAEQAADYILNNKVYGMYKTYFNIFAIFTASNESGSDHPAANSYKDTFYGSYYSQQLIVIPYEGILMATDILKEYVPEHDCVLILVNDPAYGGSGGNFAVSSKSQYMEYTILHEMGHAFIGLHDEYINSSQGIYHSSEPAAPNATIETDRTKIKWKDWINPSTPLPTPETDQYDDKIGLFEGAYFPRGIYRPAMHCKMNGREDEFCPVCTEAHILQFYRRVHPILGSYPPDLSLIFTKGQQKTFSVTPQIPEAHSLGISWFLNDSLVAVNKESIIVSYSALQNNYNTLTARVSDNTPYVRSDPESLLKEEKIWHIILQREEKFTLYPNFPNPFREKTVIRYNLYSSGRIEAVIYDVTGRKIRSLICKYQERGAHALLWNAANDAGATVSSGIYLLKISADGYSETEKLLVLK